MSSLLEDYIDRNPDSIVVLTHDSPKDTIRLYGLLTTPQLTQSMSANYGQGAKGLISRAQGMLAGVLPTGGIGGAIGGAVGAVGDVYNEYMTGQHTVMGSIKLYEGSEDVTIPINMTLFYNLMGNPSYKEMDRQLNLLSQPNVNELGLFGSNLYETAKLLEVFKLNKDALTGVLPHLLIGSWFHAKDVYVTNINKNHQTVLDEDGKPMAMTVTFNIQPYKQLTAAQLNDWIL